jgi:hypothetical protein
MMKTLPWTTAAPERPARRAARLLTAAALRAASVALDRFARRLAHVPPRATRPASTHASLEFYAEAGAPEGALYLDGELVARLPGVTRL